jgi:hypothetical protein
MVDDLDQADLLYAEALEKAKSDKLEDLLEAQRKLSQARDTWGMVNEYDKTFEGFEEKRGRAANMLGITQKEFRELNKRVDDLEQEARRQRHKAEQEEKTAPAPAPAAATAPDGVELIDENAYKKMEQDDPSEFERYKKLLDKGKARFKPKAAGETPAPAPDAKAQTAPPAPKDDGNKVPEKAPDKAAE